MNRTDYTLIGIALIAVLAFCNCAFSQPLIVDSPFVNPPCNYELPTVDQYYGSGHGGTYWHFPLYQPYYGGWGQPVIVAPPQGGYWQSAGPYGRPFWRFAP